MFPDGDRLCDGCGEWHPEYWFNDEATELCDDCMDDWAREEAKAPSHAS